MPRFRALTAFALLLAAGTSGYTVRVGDTMSAIASRLRVDLAGLVKANRAKVPNPDRIFPGQVLDLPGGPAKAAAPAPPPPPLSTAVVVIRPASITHVVRPGETLSAIAAQLHTTAGELAAANGITVKRILKVGQTLTLTGPPYLCPVQGPRNYIDSWGFPRAGGKRHEGNDVMAARGTPVVAPVGGVLELRRGGLGGNAFYLHGDDGQLYYGAHLDAFNAGAGPIARGQQIGLVGDTGDAKGGPTHLHFELHPNGGPAVDPYFTLKAWGC